MFYSVIETQDFSLFNQSAQALLKGYFIKSYINTSGNWENEKLCGNTTPKLYINTEKMFYICFII